MVLNKPILLGKLCLMVHESSLVAHKFVICASRASSMFDWRFGEGFPIWGLFTH